MSSSFNESLFEKKLLQLRETHESISNLSSWCLAHQSHHSKIISIWLSVLKRVKIEHRLLLFYLANDVIQYSRRKHLPFVEAFAPALQKATTMVREDSVKNKVLRLFKIWDDRGIYDEAFLLDLSGLLICDPKGGNRMDIQDFQPNVMYSRIRSCKKLEDDTDLKLKVLNESTLPLTNIDQLRKTLKDREQGEDVMEDVEHALTKIKAYVDALEAEIKERAGLLDMLDTGEQYYEKDLREAKIVVNAYKCFGQRVKQVQKKLEEKMPLLPSPIPSPPDVNAPSPSPPMSPDEERDVSNFNASNFAMGDSFINNSSAIEKALDSQHNSFYNERPNDFYPPAVYTPSMTTGAGRDSIPYTPTLNNTSQYDSADTSFNSRYGSRENVYNNSVEDIRYDEEDYASTNARNSQYNSDSQLSNESYPAEYFIGANSSDATAYPGERDQRNLDSSVFSSLMDSKGGLLPPPPPPPPPPKTPSPKTEAAENKIEVIGASTKQSSLAEILQSLIGTKDKKIDSPIPMKPPPRPPTGIQEEEDWPAENDWDSPLSPPPYQEFLASDTDMRPKDVDHRNLISLTGWDSKTPDETSLDKDERAFRSGLYQDSDSSDSRSPPDHIPRLNLGPLDIPPPNSVVNNQLHPESRSLSTMLPPTNLPPPNIPPPNITNTKLPPPPPNIPPNLSSTNLSPLKLPPTNMPPPNLVVHNHKPPLPMLPPPDFNFNETQLSDMPLDNVENIDMEMSDEEERRETSPTIRRERTGLVPLTLQEDGDSSLSLTPNKAICLPPPPSPNMTLLNPLTNVPLHDPSYSLETSPRLPPVPHRMLGPPTSERAWFTPAFNPQHPHRTLHPMFQTPRQQFYHQGHPRPFRPRHFRPRFQPRW